MKALTNWKTTLGGILFGAANSLSGYYLNGGHITWATSAASLAVAFMGWFGKDNNVTGGTTPNA